MTRHRPAQHYSSPVAYERSTTASLTGRRWTVAGVLLVGAAILLVRRWEAIQQPFLWAEDGAVFVQDALAPGTDLFTEYNGQVWLVQRALVLLADVVGLSSLPFVLLVSSLVVTLLGLSILLQARLQNLFGGLGYQVVAFWLLLLLPGAWESLGTVLSVHWWLVFSAAAVLLAPAARSRTGTVLEVAWLVALGLSGLVSWIILPIAVGAVIVRRDGVAVLRCVAVIATAIVQFIVLLSSTREPSESAGLIDMARIIALRVGAVAVLGEGWLSDVTRSSTSVLILSIGGTYVIVVAIVAILGRRWPALALAASAVVSVVIGLWGAAEPLALLTLPGGGRYFVPALGFAILILVVGVTARRRWIRILGIVGLVASGFALITSAMIPSPTPPLSPDDWDAFVACVDDGGDCEVAIAPEGWRVATS